MVISSTTDSWNPPSEDLAQLCIALEPRFLDLTESWLRVKGVTLPIPKEMDSAFLLWRTAVSRFNTGDFRFKDSEKIAIREVAQWTVDRNCELRGQERKIIEWKD